MKKFSLNQQSVLNIIGSIIVVAINATINLVLSPYIVAHLGVEANGYITLANNFISYISLISIALNSMVGRFILISYRRNDLQSANEYYSSTLFGDWILSAVILVPMVLFVIWINRIINVPPNFVSDTRILFALVFFNYIFTLCMPQWTIATYCTNNLYLRSLRTALSAVIRAIVIYLLFALFTPHSYYVAIAATAMSAVGLSLDYFFCKRLMSELHWRVSWFSLSKVKELISSGIWNTVSQCGNLLLEGLDILIANLFINPVASGVLALSKLIPNMINQITGTVATTYGPRLTYLYADGRIREMAHEIKNNIMVVSVLANIPIGVFAAFGVPFFNWWVPSQDAVQLSILSGFSLFGMTFAGLSQCFVNVFGIVNKLKLNSLVVIASGLMNVIVVFLLLKFTTLGVYAVVGTSSIISIIRIFAFTIPYSARLIHASAWSFTGYLIKGASNVLVPITIGFIITYYFDIAGIWNLVVGIIVTASLSLVIDCYLILNKRQRTTILKKLHLVK